MSSTSPHHRTVLLCSLWLLLVAAPLLAGLNQWSSEGPGGGPVLTLGQDSHDPAILYAGTTRAGLWKSTDGAASWFPINNGLGRIERQILALAVHPSQSGILLIHTVDDHDLFRSTDGGASWSPFGQGLASASLVGVIRYAPSDGEIVYAGAHQDVLVSHDGGATWASTASGFDNTTVTDLVVHPTEPSIVYAAQVSGQILKTTDGGLSWQPASTGATLDGLSFRSSIAIDPTDPETLYAAVGSNLYKTTDGGGMWHEISTSIGVHFLEVAVDPRAPSHIFAGTLDRGVYRSTDGGAHWTLDTLAHDPSLVFDFAFGPPGSATVYFADAFDGGVFRSDDGSSWKSTNKGLLASQVSSFTLDPVTSTLFAAADNGIHRRPLDPALGQGWELLADSRAHGQCCRRLVVDPLDPQRLYASGDESGVIRSTDGGTTWSPANNGRGQGGTTLVIDPLSPHTLYVGSFDGVDKSVDGASSWHDTDFPSDRVLHLVFNPADPDQLLAVTSYEIYQTFDGASTWSLLGNAPGPSSRAVIFDPLDPSRLYGASETEVTRSVDGGASWFALGSEGLPDDLYIDSLAVDPRDGTTLYLGTLTGLYASTDGGSSWQPFEGGISPDVWVTSLFIDPGPPATVHAGTYDAGAYSLTRGCIDSPSVLCLDRQAGDKRFAVSIAFDTALGGGLAGDAEPTALDSLGIDDGGVFSFFSPDNPEALVKIVDACGFNERFWVFAAATTSVGFELTVEDTLSRTRQVYTNSDDHPADTITDIDAFATCDIEPLGGAGSASRGVAGPASPLASPRRTVAHRSHDVAGCVADATTLCLDDQPGDRRFAIRLHFESTLGNGVEGDATATPLAPLGITGGGILSFFSPSLPEVLVKMVDGCGYNGRYWLFYAATTNLGFELTVEDTHTGASKTYSNPDGLIADTITDIDALATCDG